MRTTLPIYDAVTGEAVSEDADKLVERVRDALLDDARERVDTLGEAATEAESLGAAIDRAYAARFSQAAATEGKAAAGPVDDPAAATGAAAGDADAEYAGKSAPVNADGGGADAAAPAAGIGPGKGCVTHDEGPEPLAQGSAVEPKCEKRDAQMHDAVPGPDGGPLSSAADVKAAGSNGTAATGTAEEEPGAATEAGDVKVMDVIGSVDGFDEKQQKHSDATDDTALPGSASAAKTEGPSTATLDDIDTSVAEDTPSAPSNTAHQADSAKEHGSGVMPTAEAASSAEAKAGQEPEASEDPQEDPLPASLSEAEQRLLDWHWSNLEYGCSASLDQVFSALQVCITLLSIQCCLPALSSNAHRWSGGLCCRPFWDVCSW